MQKRLQLYWKTYEILKFPYEKLFDNKIVKTEKNEFLPTNTVFQGSIQFVFRVGAGRKFKETYLCQY